MTALSKTVRVGARVAKAAPTLFAEAQPALAAASRGADVGGAQAAPAAAAAGGGAEKKGRKKAGVTGLLPAAAQAAVQSSSSAQPGRSTVQAVKLVWPPPESALASHPELAEAVSGDSASRSAPAAASYVPSEEEIHKCLQKLGSLASEKLPNTRMVAVNKSSLALIKLAVLRDVLASLKQDTTGVKPVIVKRLLDLLLPNYAHKPFWDSPATKEKDATAGLTPGAAPHKPSVEAVKASLQRLARLAMAKLPHTHEPSITKSALALIRARYLRDELAALGQDHTGQKPVVMDRLFDVLMSVDLDGTVERDRRRRGVSVEAPPPPPARSDAAAGSFAEGSSMSGTRRPERKQPGRGGLLRERKTYLDTFPPQDIIQMLLKAHARNVVMIPVKDRCPWTDAMIIAEGQSLNHLEALAGAVYFQIKERLRENGQVAEGVHLKVEGLKHESPEWLLLDAGSVIVHIFTERARQEYNLEELWGQGQEVQRFGDAKQELPVVTLEERPSKDGEVAVGTLSRGAGMPEREVLVVNNHVRERIEKLRLRAVLEVSRRRAIGPVAASATS